MNIAWFGFWVFMAVFVAADYYIFLQGYDSYLQKHKTAEEKELQKLKIEYLKLKIESCKSKDDKGGE